MSSLPFFLPQCVVGWDSDIPGLSWDLPDRAGVYTYLVASGLPMQPTPLFYPLCSSCKICIGLAVHSFSSALHAKDLWRSFDAVKDTDILLDIEMVILTINILFSYYDIIKIKGQYCHHHLKQMVLVFVWQCLWFGFLVFLPNRTVMQACWIKVMIRLS